jgi:hypothetical protein
VRRSTGVEQEKQKAREEKFITKNANKMQHLQVVEIGFTPMIIFII